MNSQDILSELLATIFDNATDPDQPDREQHRQDFVFHMLDWKDDLKDLAELYSAPERYPVKEAEKVVQAFLYHAASHIVAAARLSDFFLDAFGAASPLGQGPD